MKRLTWVISLLIMMLPVAAFSQGYVGGSVGQSDTGSEFDKGTSWSVLGGYRFGDYFAVEASYIDYGEADDDFEPIWTIKGDAVDLAVLGFLPITEKFEVFAKLGYGSWDIELHEQGLGKLEGLDGEDLNYGIGLAFYFTDRFSVTGGFQRYEFKAFGEKAEIDNIYVGAKYYFGTRSKKPASTQTYAASQTQPTTGGTVQLRAVSESEKSNCAFIRSVTTGAGGPGDPSAHSQNAMNKALADAAKSGADSYYVVDMNTSATGASVVLEALKCN